MRISVLFYFVISSIICESRSDSLTEFFQWDFSGHWSGNRFTLKICICMILKDWFKVECSCTFRRHELGQYSAGFWFGRQRSKRSFSTDDDIYRFRYSPRAPIFPPVQVIAITIVRNGMDQLTFQRKLHVLDQFGSISGEFPVKAKFYQIKNFDSKYVTEFQLFNAKRWIVGINGTSEGYPRDYEFTRSEWL